MTRADLETMCAPAMARVRAVLESALAASGMTPDQIDSVEVVGGGSRVPWIKSLCSEVFGGKDLSTTMNQEETVCRGSALQAAILSPLYKVRDYKVSFDMDWLMCVGINSKSKGRSGIGVTGIPWVNSVGESNFWGGGGAAEEDPIHRLRFHRDRKSVV